MLCHDDLMKTVVDTLHEQGKPQKALARHFKANLWSMSATQPVQLADAVLNNHFCSLFTLFH